MQSSQRLLIFIVAYNAERHIEKVLDRIPKTALLQYDYEILIIDDQSKDHTFENALRYQELHPDLHITVLYNPVNQGYGGNQKLGYHYAQLHGFDIVLLLHGDGQYAPEEFERLIHPILQDEADAVFGSRMMNKRDALKGKMPYYKFVGNILLTRMQNLILGTHLSDFHSGYRAYRVQSLAHLPIERNSNDFHFDTQIIIQLVLAKMKIVEVPIPTHYGDEICYVNGTQYAYNIIVASIHSRLQSLGIFYKREYDLQHRPDYKLKDTYPSTHSYLINKIQAGSKILMIGGSDGLVSERLRKKNCTVYGYDILPSQFPSRFDQFISIQDLDSISLHASEFDIIILDGILENIKEPEKLMDHLRDSIGLSNPEIYIVVANIGFFITRFSLLFGGFNYGRRGILDLNHTRLFTKKSIIKLCHQSGFEVQSTEGIPAPYPEAIGDSVLAHWMVALNNFSLKLFKGLFSYQYVLSAKAKPSVKNLIRYTLDGSEKKKKELIHLN